MRHFRYLACLSGTTVVAQAGTLDELHQKLLARIRTNGFHLSYKEIDTWTEPGQIAIRDHGLVWVPGEILQSEPSFDALVWLVQVLRVVVPLGAAAQRERLRLSSRVTDYLGDMLYVLGPPVFKLFDDAPDVENPFQLGLPINPPALPHWSKAELKARGVLFYDHIGEDSGMWFWTHDDRPWAVGPYGSKRLAKAARERFLKLTDGPRLRPGWSV